MGDHVVQLAGDASALFLHVLVSHQAPLALGTLGTLDQLGRSLATAAHVVAQDDGGGEHDGRGHQRLPGRRAGDDAGDHERDDHQ